MSVPTRGYERLSKSMSENNHVIFKIFGKAALRDILYQQAQLVDLETEYDKISQSNRASGDMDTALFDIDWCELSLPINGKPNEQWTLALDIRAGLDQYYTSILRYRDIKSLLGPKESERVQLNTWIQSPDIGGGCDFVGEDLACRSNGLVYREAHKKDLLSLSASRGENDALTEFIQGPGLRIMHRFWGYWRKPVHTDIELPSLNPASGVHPVPSSVEASKVWYYSNKTLERITIAIITVLSSLVPLTSIIILSFVENLVKRLGIVCGFTLSFSLILALATSARRIEIFAATAAFASVQVVYVGSTISG